MVMKKKKKKEKLLEVFSPKIVLQIVV